jgi:hypothetical protein
MRTRSRMRSSAPRHGHAGPHPQRQRHRRRVRAVGGERVVTVELLHVAVDEAEADPAGLVVVVAQAVRDRAPLGVDLPVDLARARARRARPPRSGARALPFGHRLVVDEGFEAGLGRRGDRDPPLRPSLAHAPGRARTPQHGAPALPGGAEHVVPQRRRDAEAARTVLEVVPHVLLAQEPCELRARATLVQRVVGQVVGHIARDEPGGERKKRGRPEHEVEERREREANHGRATTKSGLFGWSWWAPCNI